MKYLEERDIGFDVGVTKVPLVVQSCIFDLVIGNKNARPDGKMAYKACENASYDTFLQGNYGPEWARQSANIWGVSAA